MTENTSLYLMLHKLTDKRTDAGKRYPLPMVVMIIIMAVLSGYETVISITDFIKYNSEKLIKLFRPKKNKLPSIATISRILNMIDFKELCNILKERTLRKFKIYDEKIFSLDGKVIRSTVTNPNSNLQKLVNLVSVFGNTTKQVVAVGELEGDKKSEIPVVKELIKELGLEGVCFTLDALHCQKETTKTIIKSKNDYIIGVKGNQKSMYEEIKKKQKN